MGMAFKVAGNSYHSTRHRSSTSTAPLERKYIVKGYWPQYKVRTLDEPWPGKWVVCWGKRSLQAHLVSLRMEGYVPYWRELK